MTENYLQVEERISIRLSVYLWPVLVILLGVGFILLFEQRNRSDIVLLCLGVFFIECGAFFTYLNFTGWKNLRTQWPIFLGFAGICFMACHIARRRNRVYFYLGLAFIMAFISLFLIFTVSPQLWPVSLVILGVSLLIVNYYNNRESSRTTL